LDVIAALSCGRKPPPERWIIPENYTGWLRLDYAVSGAPMLPIDHGVYVVRMPAAGRLETSSPYNSTVDQNEYFVVSGPGLRRLEFTEMAQSRSDSLAEEYTVRNVFGFFVFASGTVHRPGKCVFVGTMREFRANGRDCREWEPGQSEPPRFKKPYRAK
jgi:hypothetical protein